MSAVECILLNVVGSIIGTIICSILGKIKEHISKKSE